ncbi:MAG: hypothetical protein IPG67_17050 [Acidobacteria bacterium]|nr:hypothetical protein [Acidobacteriota bacterium]
MRIKAGKEQVFIRSQKRYDPAGPWINVRNMRRKSPGGLWCSIRQQPGGNLTLPVTVGGNYDLPMKDSHYVGIDGS